LGRSDAPRRAQVFTTAPLRGAKEGQEGQWRVISDMLRGENQCIAGDPVLPPRISHILDQMYSNGYSAVVDASKYFYQFPTHPADRLPRAEQHPITGSTCLSTLGSQWSMHSPLLGVSRHGLSFIRMLKDRFKSFKAAQRLTGGRHF
jgi:hypothetical protein